MLLTTARPGCGNFDGNRKDLDVEHIFCGIRLFCYFVFLLMISACDHCNGLKHLKPISQIFTVLSI